MKKQGAIRYRPAVRRPTRSEVTPGSRVVAHAQLVDMVGRIAAEDPARARAFLLLLRKAMKTGKRNAVSSVLAAFGGLGCTIAEAARPTPLKVRPASLEDSWNAVGRAIGSSMIGYGERHDHHAG